LDEPPKTRAKGGSFPGDHPCAHPGCPEPGAYRAPVSRPGSSFLPPSGPPRWQYFCLDHVRAFNAQWNWFDGMSQDEIWEAQSPAPAWERETRAFAANAFAAGPDRAADALGVLRWKAAARPQGPTLSRDDRQALAKLGLEEGATLAQIKARYRSLARRYHPDANKGSREHEAKLQALTEAHTHLIGSAAFKA
jgi:DnaJ domain